MLKTKPKQRLETPIRFNINEDVENDINRLIEHIGGVKSEQLRCIFLYGLSSALDLLNKGFKPLQSEYKSLNKLHFTINVDPIKNIEEAK